MSTRRSADLRRRAIAEGVRVRKVSVVAVALVLSGTCTACTEHGDSGTPEVVPVANWDDLHTMLSTEVAKATDRGQVTVVEALRSSRTFKALAGSNNRVLWDGMVRHSESPLVVVAGVLCIHEADARGSAYAALGAIVDAQSPTLELYGALYEIVQEHRWGNRDCEYVCGVLSAGRIAAPNAAAIARVVPLSFVRDCLLDARRLSIHPHVLAYCVERVYVAHVDGETELPHHVRELLASFRAVPGLCRYMYVMYTEESGPVLEAALLSVVHDPRVSNLELALLLRRRRNEIREHAAGLYDVLDEERSRLLRRVLSERRE